jgi:acrylyl-CoA reductase (NADPH)/3-hydroxypropionyl-CoA dehydratase/3-hydroxypropionyl-CoA synthetase
MRDGAIGNPGDFHGRLAEQSIYWYVAEVGVEGSWLIKGQDGGWSGWDVKTANPVSPALPASFAPWDLAFDASDAPHWRWFSGARTNAVFSEVDRHVLDGHGDETALIFEGDRWDMSLDGGRGGPVDCFKVDRKSLLLETAKCAVALKRLGLKAGDRIALNMPNIVPQIFWIEAAKRLGVVYTPVFGGFSDKTLSDRICDAGAKVIVTCDGSYRNAQVAAFKTAYTDPALDNYVPVKTALEALRSSQFGLSVEDADLVRRFIAEDLAGEVTVERSDIMRGVGRALLALGKDGRISAAEAVKVRTEIASKLIDLPARVERVIVVRHTGQAELIWRPERDVWSHDLTENALQEILAAAREKGFDLQTEADLLQLPAQDFVRAIWASSPPTPLDAEFPMFLIYTSGSTGKPKGVVHVHGGYTAGVASTMPVAFDARPGDVMFVVADPGWITGQSYLISAALTSRIVSVIAEGSPIFPHAGRFTSMIERHRVTIFKAGVTFLKSIMSDPQNLGDLERYDRSSLRVATFCAEPTSPSVQAFGMAHVTSHYINSYWSTEHGGIAWTHFYGNADFPLRADAHAFPLPWIVGDVWVEDTDGGGLKDVLFPRGDEDGTLYRRAEFGEKGEIVIAAPYPYLARTIWGDSENFKVARGKVVGGWRGDAARWADGYWKRWRGAWAYTQGDFAIRHEDGSFSLHGRSDDVINVSGHRMGTEEIEGALLRDKALTPDSPVGNVLVVGAPHREKGLTPLAFVVPVKGRKLSQDDRRRLMEVVRTEKGAVAVPADFIEVSQFPETRSGKYMRRMVRALITGEPVGDVTTLRNPEALVELKGAIEAWQRRQQIEEDQPLFERYRYFLVQYNLVAPGKRVATVTVTNPPVNALNERSIDELVIVVDHLARKEDVVAVVFTGSGTSSFVAGADIRQMLEEIHTLEEARVLPNNAQLAFRKIETMGKPCIAAIQGVALGGGMEFALACHYRIAESFARFGQPEIRLRLLPGYGGTQRLPRLLGETRGAEGLRDALDLILGGRSVDGQAAAAIGLVDSLTEGSEDALSKAHQAVRDYVANGADSALGRAFTAHKAMIARWEQPFPVEFDTLLEAPFLAGLLRQLDWAGRGEAGRRALDAVKTGLEQGVSAGFSCEAAHFAEAIIDPQGGKTGIRQFLDKTSPPLPVRRGGVIVYEEHEARSRQLEAEGRLLPVGAPFYPGVSAIPPFQYAFGIARDPETGAPRFGQPVTHEKEMIVSVTLPNANEALLYMLTSEVNFNDIWALTGIPVSPFDAHEEDVQVTGSGGIGLVVALGSETKAQGRVKVGDLVNVYSGTSDLLSPLAAIDPMFAGFAIQGYETATGSHAQFLVVQAPQMHPVPHDLTLEQAGSYILNLGTVWRCLFTTLKIAAGRIAFIEGASTGTGLDALKVSVRTGLRVTGLVSSPERAAFILTQGAVSAINRKDADFANLYTVVPEGEEASRRWEDEGRKLVRAFKEANGGHLADYVVSHAGETAFPRSFQLLAEGGRLAFYGASSGYHFTFMGKAGHASPETMLREASLRGGESVLIYYGPRSTALIDEHGLELIEAARQFNTRTVVTTTTDAQRDFLQSLGLAEAIRGVVSLESIARREGGNFNWPETMPRLPSARDDIEVFRAAVRDYQDKTLKPFGAAVGRILSSADNPRGAPDLILERAAQDTLAVSTALVKPFTGRVVYTESMAGQRFSFYAPQVWTRQRKIIMPTAAILGTHLCNASEVAQMNDMLNAGLLEVTEPNVVDWSGLPAAHQSLWDNRHEGATYVVNHALPALGLRKRDELLELWSSSHVDRGE